MSAAAPAPDAAPDPAAASRRVTGGAFTTGDWALFGSIAGIWGASFLFIAIGLESLSPGTVTLLRVGLGALTLNLLPGPTLRVAPGDRLRVVALSILWVGIPFTLFPIAEQSISSAVTGLLNGAMPLFTALLGALFFASRTSGAQLVGVVIGFVGVIAISAPSVSEGATEAWGVALVLLATLCYGFAINLAAPLQARYGARPLMARILALATLWTLPYGVVGLPSSSFAVGPALAVAVLGLVGTGLAFLIMGTLVGRVGSTRASFITYLIPVVALVLGVVFQGDRVEGLALVGVVLVVGGAVLAGRAERPRAAAPDPRRAGGGVPGQ